MEKELLQKCNLIARNASIVARDEIRLFCQIMGWSDTDVYFVADDPHGVVSLGDYFFNMSDIHEVVANYPKLLERYGSNEELSNIIIRWYDWTLEYHSKHPQFGWIMSEQKNMLTGEKTKIFPEKTTECRYYFVHTKTKTYVANHDSVKHVFWGIEAGTCIPEDSVLYWSEMILPTDEHYINLHSWLMGACEIEIEKGDQK